MGRLDVRDPIAHRLVDGVLERRSARRDRPDLRPERAHPQHVRLLALDVLGAHVDDARQAEQRAGSRGRDAVLAGARLGDDAGLAETPGQQRLAEGVVDLVGAGVREVLALEMDPETVRQPRRSLDGDRPLQASRTPADRPGRGPSAGRRSARGAREGRPRTAGRGGSRRRHPRAVEARTSVSLARSAHRNRARRPIGRSRRPRAGPGGPASGGRRGSVDRGGRRGRA